jgi:glucan-binding YG repeat protein
MSSIKQLIINAVMKVSAEDPALNREGAPTADEARDLFIARLVAELFPEHGTESSAIVVPVVEPTVEPVAPATTPAKKLTKEEKEAAKAAKAAEKEAATKAKEEAKAAKEAAKVAKAASPKASPEEKKAAKEAEKAAAAKAKEEAKAAAAAAKEAEKAAAKAAKEAEKEAAKAAKAEAKKTSPKKAAEVVLPASPKPEPNLAKIDPTWRKTLKEADKDNAKALEPELLKFLNAMSNADFHGKTAREHVAAFIAARAPVAEPAAQVDLEVVEFNGKDYYVNPETKRVYEGVTNAEGELTVTRPVGYVGMADFKDMTLE